MASRTFPPFDDDAAEFAVYRSSGAANAQFTGAASSTAYTLAHPLTDNQLFDQSDDPNVVVMDEVQAANFDAVVVWRWENQGTLNSTTIRGFSIHGRLPGAGAPGYSANVQGTTGNLTIVVNGAGQYGSGSFDSNRIGESVTKTFGGFTAGVEYAMRFRVTESVPAGASLVQVRVWIASDAEPSTWDLEATLVDGEGSPTEQLRYVAGPGLVGFSNGGNGGVSGGVGTRGRLYTVSSFVVTSTEIEQYPPPEPPPPPPPGLSEQPRRIRSSYEATLGRTLVGTPQADISVQETVPRGDVSVGTTVSYATVVRPEVPIALLRVIEDTGGLPIYEQTAVYESTLAALGRMFPSSVYVTAQQAIGEDTMTAQEVLQWLFDQWAVEFPEFRARPAPPLLLFVTDDDGQYTRTLTTDRIVLRQPEGRRRSIAQLLEDLREWAPGYAVTVDAEGYVVLVPPPWAGGTVPVTPGGYRAGPGYTLTPAELGVASRTDFTDTTLAVAGDFDGEALVISGTIIQEARRASGATWWSIGVMTGRRVPYTLTLEPGVPQDITATLQALTSSGWTQVGRARYRLTWTRPGSTGGTITATVLEATTSGTITSLIQGDVLLDLTHALTVDGAGEPAIGVRNIVVAGNEVALPLPAPALDGSRVINAQTATHAEVDFVDATPLLPTLAVRRGPTDYTPSGATVVPLGEFQPFLDDEGAPLIVGGQVTVTWLYELRTASSADASSDGGCAQTGVFGTGPCLTFTGSFSIAPGQSRTLDIVLDGEWALTFGRILTIRWQYRQQADGQQGLVVTFANVGLRTNNAAAARPWMAHVVSWDTDGSVWQETGVVYQATYDEVNDTDAALSQALYGRREGPPIEVNLFAVNESDLQQIVQGIVRYNLLPRGRYLDVQLTPASDLTPDSLNYTLLMPFGVAGLMEAYRYADARTPDSVLVQRAVDLVVLYTTGTSPGGGGSGSSGDGSGVEVETPPGTSPGGGGTSPGVGLITGLATPATDVALATESAYGAEGASYVIDAD